MSRFSSFAICILFILVITDGAFAVGPWIMEWYALDPVRDTGTHANGFAIDWLEQIFGEEEAWFSEIANVPDDKMVGEHRGEDLGWFVGDLKNNDDDRNLSNGIYGGKWGDMSNYVFYGMIAVTSPKDQDTVMHVAQDDELKVWIDGELAATDTSWTGGATTTRPHNVHLDKGVNIMLVKVSEEGGGDYLNVRFDAEDLDFDAEVWKLKRGGIPPVDTEEPGVPSGSCAATWGTVKTSSVVYIEEQQVDVNTVFDADVRVSRAKNLAGFQVSLNYDPHNLRFVRAQEGKALSRDGATSFWRQPEVDTEAGTIVGAASTLAEAGSIDVEDDVLMTFTFETKELGRTMIWLQDVKLSDPEGKLIPLLVTSAFITISPPWDVVTDSVIDIRDMAVVGQNLVVPLTAPGDVDLMPDADEYNPDVDRNGVVDVDDLIIVSSHFGESYKGSNTTEKLSPIAELRKAYYLIDAAPGNSPDIDRFKAHLARLIVMDRAISPPVTFRLLPNYPNPFNPATWIPYQLAQASDVTISIFTASGQLVRILDLGHKEAGSYTSKDKAVYWDGRNERGEELASGVYFYVMRAGDFTATCKMLMEK
jgi:hypothetical protein